MCTNSNIKIVEGESKVDMCGGLKALLEEGREEGREEGQRSQLASIIQKKLERGESIEKIADDLVQEVSVVISVIEDLQLKQCK